MGDAYLEFKVLNGSPGTFTSKSATTAKRMFIATYPADTPALQRPIQEQQSKPVDLTNLLPCGMESRQSWEDGGTYSTWTAADADFHYYVSGACGTVDGLVRLTE